MVSRMLTSPIPTDPTDWVTDSHFHERQSTTYAPRGRVRPEAEQIAYKSRNGTVARLFSVPEARTPRYKREYLFTPLNARAINQNCRFNSVSI